MAARGAQSNTMLYSLITFVGLFVIATVCAVVFYVKSEEYRTQFETKRNDTEQIASSREQTAITSLVGKAEQGKTYLGTTLSLIDKLYQAITGKAPAEGIPADVKANDAIMQVNTTLEALDADATAVVGADGVALVHTIGDLKQKLDAARVQMQQLQSAYYTLEDDMDELRNQMQQRQTLFVGELAVSESLTDEVRDRFDQLQRQMQSATQEQIDSYRDRLEQEQANLRARQAELQETERRMQELDTQLQASLDQLEAIKPRPDAAVAAYKSDARTVRVDLQNDLVTLDVGANYGVYRGLTFSIYQSNVPIPENGVGKAEIEVFQVGEQVSVARIVRQDPRNPIIPEDLVVNLIWDAETSNKFIVIGDFDTTRDGRINPDGAAQVRELIERWGGRLQDDIGIDTDFVIVGFEPAIPQRPTEEELDVDPTALQRYETASRQAEIYNEMLAKAGRLRVPVFNYQQFIHLIGYDTLSTKLGAS
ncbi:MAG: hypothetical protein GXY41_02420 [Phycisphaerae bacterium]|nr:hypothetical protein [Phycisphaerae bacterium]